ncbi:MAG: SGNH/GDSL hydrolase family protein [Thermoanaerobaculia bacterium]
MRIKTKAINLTAVLALTMLTAAPVWAARGKADFTRYVALGDSYGAGVSSNALVDAHQRNGYVAVIARQAGANDFQQPLVSQPGIGPELQLLSIRPLQIVPKASTNGVPTNLFLPRPYNNLSIPGARVLDLLTINGNQPPTNTTTTFAQFILRGLGTATDQALAQQPTFISVWIGGNDLLGAVLGGTPAALTPLADFEAAYTALLDRLVAGAPNAGMVLGSLADAASVPFATTIPPVLVDPATNQPVIVGGSPIFYIADLGGGQIGQLTPGSLVTLGASSFLSTGFGIPSQVAPAIPLCQAPGNNCGKPLPDGVVITPAELAAIRQRGVEMNAVIFAAGAARDIPVVDINTFFEHAKAGLEIGGITINTAFLTGGMFSYDGFHPTDIGYALLANEFIRTINANYGTKIPYTSILRFFQNNNRRSVNARHGEEILPGTSFEYTREALDGLFEVTGAPNNLPVTNRTRD